VAASRGQSHATLAALNHPDRTALPPLPAGAEDLTFAEFFGPIGDRGLEYSARLRALDVRLVLDATAAAQFTPVSPSPAR
jgi:hypothetical protein